MMRTLTWMVPAALAFAAAGVASAQPTPEAPAAEPAADGDPAEATAAESGEADGAAEGIPETEAPSPADATEETKDGQAPPVERPATPAQPDEAEAADEEPPAAPPKEHEPLPGLDALGSHQAHWWLDLGVRTSYVNDSGYDPFSYDDALIQFSVGGGRTVFSRGSLSAGVGLVYEVGGTSADARGDITTLLVQRVVLAPEIRNHLWARMYVFAQPALGLLRTRATLDDSASGVTLEAKNWGTAFDLTAGGAYQIYGRPSGEKATPRLWIGAQGGYGWGRKVHLEMSPDDDSYGPERIAPLDLGDLTLRGPTFRISGTLSY